MNSAGSRAIVTQDLGITHLNEEPVTRTLCALMLGKDEEAWSKPDQLNMDMVCQCRGEKTIRYPTSVMNQLLDPHFSSSDPTDNLRQ